MGRLLELLCGRHLVLECVWEVYASRGMQVLTDLCDPSDGGRIGGEPGRGI